MFFDGETAKKSSIKTQLGLDQVNSEPTRKRAVLDYILSKAPKCNIVKTRAPIGNSDHQTAKPNRRLYRTLMKVKNKRKLVRTGKMVDLIEEYETIDLG